MPVSSSASKGVVLLLTALLAVLAASSCVRVRSPGIMPPFEETAFGEWVLLSKEYSPSRSGQVQGSYRLAVTLQYLLSEKDRPLSGDDLRVLFDGESIPFTFSETDQILTAEVTSVFGVSLRHSLVVRPAGKSSASFPTLTIAFE